LAIFFRQTGPMLLVSGSAVALLLLGHGFTVASAVASAVAFGSELLQLGCSGPSVTSSCGSVGSAVALVWLWLGCSSAVAQQTGSPITRPSRSAALVDQFPRVSPAPTRMQGRSRNPKRWPCPMGHPLSSKAWARNLLKRGHLQSTTWYLIKCSGEASISKYIYCYVLS